MLKMLPDHPILIEPRAGNVVVKYDGVVVADTNDAIVLREAEHLPVIYIPRQDVDLCHMFPSDLTTTCPYKGLASYFDIVGTSKMARDAAWSYEDPKPVAEPIRGYISFLPHIVDFEVE